MIFVVRGLVWLAGSLSVAVLLRGALDVDVAAGVGGVLAVYEGVVAAVAPVVAPFVERALPVLDDALGTGTKLHPHWPLMFLIVLLHLLPRLDATYGVGRVAGGVLWCLQATSAVIGAVVATAILGVAPLLGDNLTANYLLLVFIVVEIISNTWGDFGDALAERVGELETGESRREVTWRSILAYASGPLVSLSAIFAVAIYYYARRMQGEVSVDAVAVALLSYGVLAVLIVAWAIWRKPRAERSLLRRGVFDAPVTHIARLALLGAALFVSGILPVESRSPRRAIRYVMVFAALAAFPVAAVVIGASFAIDWATGREWEQRPRPEPSALGLFILGGVLLVSGGYALAIL